MTHHHGNMEIYGRDGSLILPDLNFFGGPLEISRRGQPLGPVAPWDHPFGIPNKEAHERWRANYRAAGLADMVRAIREGGDFRCDQAFALHVIEAMTAILQAGESGGWIALRTTCTRPTALAPDEASALMRDPIRRPAQRPP